MIFVDFKKSVKVCCDVKELTDTIKRVQWSLPKYRSTYAVELKIIGLNLKRSTAQEDICLLDNDIDQKLFKVKNINNRIDQLKLLDMEDEILAFL